MTSDNSDREREDTRLITVADAVARIGEDLGLHPAAKARAARAVAAAVKSKAPSDGEIRSALFDLRDEQEILFTAKDTGAPADQWLYAGKWISTAALAKLPIHIRHHVIDSTNRRLGRKSR